MIASLEARGYRNLAGELSLSIDPHLTVFHGLNGAGKTNLLDALHFGLTGASMRSGAIKNAIGFESDSARVEVEFSDQTGTMHKTLASLDRSGQRRNLVDGAAPTASVPLPRVALFHPDHLQTIKGPPAHRRALADQVAGSLSPSQTDLRARYGRTLAQRNAQLRRVRAGELPVTELEVWDSRLASEAAPLVASRRDAIEILAPHFREAAITLGLTEPGIAYKTRVGGDEESIRLRLAELRAEDPGRAYVMYGPHLDDLHVEAEGRPLKQFGSQGQQRAAVLALLLGERSALAGAGRESPILLLDDVMSELDPRRRELLIGAAVAGGQVVVTATDLSQVPSEEFAPTSTSYRVEAGRIDTGADSPPLAEAV
jgi:DNA replication and repair protein RecF